MQKVKSKKIVQEANIAYKLNNEDTKTTTLKLDIEETKVKKCLQREGNIDQEIETLLLKNNSDCTLCRIFKLFAYILFVIADLEIGKSEQSIKQSREANYAIDKKLLILDNEIESISAYLTDQKSFLKKHKVDESAEDINNKIKVLA